MLAIIIIVTIHCLCVVKPIDLKRSKARNIVYGLPCVENSLDGCQFEKKKREIRWIFHGN